MGIQVVVKDSTEDFLLFLRDYVCANPEALAEYNRLKTAHTHEGAEGYWGSKDAFFREILAAREPSQSTVGHSPLAGASG